MEVSLYTNLFNDIGATGDMLALESRMLPTPSLKKNLIVAGSKLWAQMT